jgi:hypothetical protein
MFMYVFYGPFKGLQHVNQGPGYLDTVTPAFDFLDSFHVAAGQ